MNEGWNVIIRYDESFACVNVWLMNKQGNREVIVQPINLNMTVDYSPDRTMVTPEPTLRFMNNDARQFLQGLAEGLAQAGFIPDQVKVNNQELTAVKAHLEDMRTLVFQALLPPEIPSPRIEKGWKKNE